MAARAVVQLDPVEERTQAIGRDLLERVRAESRRESRWDRWTAEMLEWSMRHETSKLQLFRLIDVLPALEDDADLVRHIEEYFGRDSGPFAGLARAGLTVAGLGGRLAAKAIATTVRQAVRQVARSFIAGGTPEEAVRAVLEARKTGLAASLDFLGEACVSEEEAAVYERRYLDLLARLTAEAANWPRNARLDQASMGSIPRVNISVKLSALYPYLDPIDPEGSARAVKDRLRRILRAAAAGGAHVQIDMEERRLKDLTLAIAMSLFEEEEFRRNRNVGVVLQVYLTDTEADARRVVEWARRRGTPVKIRLVKGAYWDYETAHARLEGWPVPVYEAKGQTDAAFERITRFLLEHADAVDLGVASHNVRSIARAMAERDRLGLPPSQVEFQVLHGMAAPLARALVERGERVRVYLPFGDLIPGMAYLVRRLLENTSNESFLRRGFMEGEDAETLLAAPAASSPAPAGARAVADGGPTAEGVSVAAAASPRGDDQPGAATFPNEPALDFARADERKRFAAALEAVRGGFGRACPLYIAGQAVETAEWLDSLNPSRPAEVVGRAALGSVADVDRAVAAAGRAAAGWESLGATERASILRRAAERLRERRDELAAWIVFEAGKPWREADGDVAEAIDFLEYYGQAAIELLRPRALSDLAGESNLYRREPRGVVAVIAPWNFPLAILTGMTAAALATGNTVVLKPSAQTPVIAAELTAILHEVGLPPGVLNYVPGRGSIVGERLLHHPAVRVIAFTGSREVGTHIYAAAAQPPPGARHLTRVVAEMGGKNAVIVDDDADLDEAVQGIVASAFGYAGQKCSACSRVIGVGRIYDRLLSRLVEATRTLPLGPAHEAGTIVGPLIDAASQQRVQGYIQAGRGIAKPALIREVPAELAASGGYYVAPTIFADVPPDSALATEEIFGPVLSAMPATSFDQALELAMASEFALTGGVFSRSPGRLQQAEAAFRVGNLYLNRKITGAKVGRQPFGGRQMSGIGYPAGGPDYLLQFVEGRLVCEQTLRRGFASARLAGR